MTQKAKKVIKFNKNLERLVDDMFYAMYEHGGVGLAAPQIGFSKQIFVINCDTERLTTSEMVFINPKIISYNGKQDGQEGCLSFPGMFVERSRPETVTVEAQDIHGKKFTITVNGLAARAVLHETEHLLAKEFDSLLNVMRASVQ